MDSKFVQISSVGLDGKDAYVAHAKGNWGPELENSDHVRHPLNVSKDGKYLICSTYFLEPGEEFKIVVPVEGEGEAKKIYGTRISNGAHVNTRFDFDANHNTLWLLASSHPVVRPGDWDQNNVNL